MGIKIDWKILIFLSLFLVTGQSKTYAIIMAFALVHETGHLIAGMLLGLRPQKMRILPFGASISFEYCNKTNLQKLIIPLAGPITNALIAIIMLFMPEFTDRTLIIYSNILIAIFNLLPIYPLDGGRIIKALLERKNNKEQSSNIINKISNITAVILTILASIGIIYLQNIAILFIIAYIWVIIISENRKHKTKKKVYAIIKADRKKREKDKNKIAK